MKTLVRSFVYSSIFQIIASGYLLTKTEKHLVIVSVEEINTASQYCDITVYTEHLLHSFCRATCISNYFL